MVRALCQEYVVVVSELFGTNSTVSGQMEREGATRTVPLFVCYNMVRVLHQEYVVVVSELFGTNSTVSGQLGSALCLPLFACYWTMCSAKRCCHCEPIEKSEQVIGDGISGRVSEPADGMHEPSKELSGHLQCRASHLVWDRMPRDVVIWSSAAHELFGMEIVRGPLSKQMESEKDMVEEAS